MANLVSDMFKSFIDPVKDALDAIQQGQAGQNESNEANSFYSSGGHGIDEGPQTLQGALSSKNPVDALINGPFITNPSTWPIIGSNGSKNSYYDDLQRYRNENPVSDDAYVKSDNGYLISSDSTKSKYSENFAKHGGINSGYTTGADDFSKGMAELALNQSNYLAGDKSAMSESPYDKIRSGLGKISSEGYDDGTMNPANLRSRYMTGARYKEYQDIGMGGRPSYLIDDNALYDKVSEQRNYNYVPYIEDQDQIADWMIREVPDNASKLFSMFGDLRDMNTQEYYDYNGRKVDRDAFQDEARKWIAESPKSTLWTVELGNGEIDSFMSDEEPVSYYDEDGIHVIVSFPGTDRAYRYDDIDDFNANSPKGMSGVPSSDLAYTQPNGDRISFTPSEYLDFVDKVGSGDLAIDYGLFGKNANERKDFTEMLTTLDPSDLPAATVDMILQSAPLWFNQTAWPRSVSDAIVATEGIDPRLYDWRNDTRRAVSEDKDLEKYLSNIAFSGTTPLTERIAGVVGGGGGIVGKPLQNILARYGAPGGVRHAVDILGEGAEENVASLWENYQGQKLENLFANPYYEKTDGTMTVDENDPDVMHDETGEPVKATDATGHVLFDSNTNAANRVANALEQAPEDNLAGDILGLIFGVPKIIGEKTTKTGYYDPYLKTIDDLKKNLDIIEIGPESIGTYGEGR